MVIWLSRSFSGMTGEAAELKAEVQQMRQLLAEATRSGAVGGGSPPRSTTGSVAMHTPFASPGAGMHDFYDSVAFVTTR